jgi:integrase
MSGIKLTAQKIEKLPYSSKRTLYIDKHPTTKYQSCDFILVVGARTKTAFLRHRPKVNGVRKQQMIKLGDATVISLSELRDMYLEEVIKIRRGESEYLVAKDQREITLGNLVDIYITGKEQGKGKDVSKYDKEQMKRLMNQKLDRVLVGDLKCVDLDSDVIKKILKEDVDKDSMYVASQKREYIQRVWNYSIKNSKAKALDNIKNPASFSMVDWIDWKKEPSEKFIEVNDFPEFFKVVDSIGRSDFRDIIKMSLFTGQHPYAEIAKMRWDQIQEVEGQTWWIMEKGFHKIDKPHQFPLHKMMLDIINKYKGNDDVYVFKNIYDKDDFYHKDNVGNVLGRLRKTHNIQWDLRCLRSSFLTAITNLDHTFRAGILCNQAGQNITESVYIRGKITYFDFKVQMINAYMDLIQDKLNENS